MSIVFDKIIIILIYKSITIFGGNVKNPICIKCSKECKQDISLKIQVCPNYKSGESKKT